MNELHISVLGIIISIAFLSVFLYGAVLNPSMFCFNMTEYNEHYIEIPMLIFAVVVQICILLIISKEERKKRLKTLPS